MGASPYLVAIFIKEPYIFAIPVTGHKPAIYFCPHNRLITELAPAEVAFVSHQFHSFWAMYIWESAWATASSMRLASS